jgi:hypothetical protein
LCGCVWPIGEKRREKREEERGEERGEAEERERPREERGRVVSHLVV